MIKSTPIQKRFRRRMRPLVDEQMTVNRSIRSDRRTASPESLGKVFMSVRREGFPGMIFFQAGVHIL